MIQETAARLPLVTLVGPQNSGKTTLFNYYSGKNLKTVNYPGSTVEFTTSRFHPKYNLKANLLDSPGIMSIIPSSPDEEVSIEILYSHPELGRPDLVVVTADGTQLSRHLLLLRQLQRAKFDVVLAVTMLDRLEQQSLEIDEKELARLLCCDVVLVDASRHRGVEELHHIIERHLQVQAAHSSEMTSAPRRMEMTNQDLIDLYKEIEEIEQEVLSEKDSQSPGFKVNLKQANESLVILNKDFRRTLARKPDRTTLKIDRYLLHPVWGIFSFVAIMFVMFTAIFYLAAPLMEWIDGTFGWLAAEAVTLLGYGWFGHLIANGIISGTGAVMVFVPQIAILFFILGFLEDSGYLARGAMLIDKPLSKVGLNGKSFVPLLSGFACAVPALMAARTISNKRERFLTILVIPLMTCSARLPVYTLLLAFLIPAEKSWIAGLALAAIYFFSIIVSALIASIINRFKTTFLSERDDSSFILELPAYRLPKWNNVLRHSVESTWSYLKGAGPIILGLSISLWFLTFFPNYDPQVETAGLQQQEIEAVKSIERIETSYAADLGKVIQPVMLPLGMDWRVGVSLIAAFAAREVFVSSLALIFKVTSEDDEALRQSMLDAMRKAEIGDAGQKLFTPATIAGLIIFFVFAMQCLSTLAVAKRETGGWKIPALMLLFYTPLAYIMTLITVNGLRLLGIS